jgi:hypothetical protein
MFFQIYVAEYNPYTKQYVVDPRWNNTKTAVINAYVTVTGLTPGRCMQVVVNAYTTTTVLSQTIFWRNQRVPVTCGCPTYKLYDLLATEQTGTPAEFILSQVRSHVSLYEISTLK